MKASKFITNILALILGIAAFVGLLGSIIVVGIWWSRIRYDFPYWQNDNDEAYSLYVVVLCGWVFPIITFIAGTLNRMLSTCKLNFLASLMLSLALLSGLGEVVDLILVIVLSEPHYCNVIKSKGTYPGNTTEGYIEWYNSSTKDMTPQQKEKFDNNLIKYRCDNPNLFVTIFLSIFAGSLILSFIIVIVSQKCNERRNSELEAPTEGTIYMLSQS